MPTGKDLSYRIRSKKNLLKCFHPNVDIISVTLSDGYTLNNVLLFPYFANHQQFDGLCSIDIQSGKSFFRLRLLLFMLLVLINLP